jgi:hypothetical protein
MSTSGPALEEFRSLVEPHLSRWKTIELRIFASVDGARFTNLITHGIFRFPDDRVEPPSRTDLTERLTTLVYQEPIHRLPQLLAQLESGSLTLGGIDVIYGLGQAGSFHTRRVARGTIYGTFYDPAFDAEPYIALAGTGSGFSELCGDARLQRAEDRLRTGSVPYESAADFQEHFLALHPPEWGGFGDAAGIFITAPLGIRLSEKSVLSADRLQTQVSVRNSVADLKVRVGLVARTRKGMHREWMVIGKDQWAPVLGEISASIAWDIAGADRATLLLTADDILLDNRAITDPVQPGRTPRLIAHAVIDAQYIELNRLLRGGGRQQARDFEDAIALLLHFCGFAVASYGTGGPFTDGPDAVAFADDTVVVVECTLGPIDANAKLAKLLRRRSEIASALPGHKVVAAVFTPRPAGEIVDYDRANELEVVVVSAELIHRLWRLAYDGASTPAILKELRLTERHHFGLRRKL